MLSISTSIIVGSTMALISSCHFFLLISIKNRIICDGQYGIGMIYLILEYLIDYVLKIPIPTFIIINIASQINLDIPFLMWTGNLDFDDINYKPIPIDI